MSTSDRKAAANRVNSTRSTGPRTAAGKMRSSRNSLQHGLTSRAGALHKPEEVDRLVQQFGGGDGEKVLASRAAAEAQLDLQRIRRAKTLIVSKAMQRNWESSLLPPVGGDAQFLGGVAQGEIARELIKMDGYERKAMSRRKKALRALLD